MCIPGVAKNPMWALSPGLAALGVGKKKKAAVIDESGAAKAATSFGQSPSYGG